MQVKFLKSIGAVFPLPYWIGFIVFLLTLDTQAQREVPELWGHRIHDEASALSSETAAQLERQLEEHEKVTSNQIAILIIPTLDGEILEEFSIRVAERWKLGTEKNDNGVLLLIAIDDRKMRIEVGQGLQGVLTDAVSARIIRDEIAPSFRRGDYDAGVRAGINTILAAIAGEYTAEEPGMSTNDWLLIWGALAFFISLLVYSFYKEFKRPAGQGSSSSGSSESSSSSDWSSSSSDWSSSSSSSSESSFSGGGGSFDGGGSSGSW